MWKDIEEINWAGRSIQYRGYTEGKMYMLENFTKTRCNTIRDFVSERFDDLYDCIQTFEHVNDTHCGDYGGDDSFGDMIHHVIGLGEAKFEEIMEDPSKLNGMDYTESFSYCLPYDDDFEMLNAECHLDRARKSIVELARIVAENKPSGDDVRIIKEIMDRFLIMLAGDFKEACKDFEFSDNYSSYYKFESNDCNAMFANYINDCKTYLNFIS